MTGIATVRDQVLARADIADIAQECGFRKGRWNGWHCSWHGDGEDRRPSASIKNGRLRCFACGESWDVIALVMRGRGLRYVDAMRVLADRCGVRWPTRPYRRRVESQRCQSAAHNVDRQVEILRQRIVDEWVERRGQLLRQRSFVRRWLFGRSERTMKLPVDQRVEAFIGNPNDGRLEFALDMLERVEAELEYLDDGPEFARDGHLSGFRHGAISKLRWLSSTEFLQMLQPPEAA